MAELHELVTEFQDLNGRDPGTAAAFDQLVTALRNGFDRSGVDLRDPKQRHAAKIALACVFSEVQRAEYAPLPLPMLLAALFLAAEEAA